MSTKKNILDQEKNPTYNLMHPVLPAGFQISFRDNVIVIDFFNESYDQSHREIFSSIALTGEILERFQRGINGAKNALENHKAEENE